MWNIKFKHLEAYMERSKRLKKKKWNGKIMKKKRIQ